jgi:hypothetical protein
MNPLFGIAASVLPDIIKLVAGDKTGQFADKVVKTVSDTIGTNDATQAKAKLDADPAAQTALQQKLAELAIEATKVQNAEADRQRQDEATENDKKRQDQLEQLKTGLDNTRSARDSLQVLSAGKSMIVWTAPIISYLVIVGFFLFLFVSCAIQLW